MDRKIRQAYGNPVEGENFWGREEDLKLFIKKLEDGAHIHLLGQRRLGKTSLMRETARSLKERFHCILVDLQKDSSPQDIIATISFALSGFQDLWTKTKELFKNILSAIPENQSPGIDVFRAALNAGNWMERGEQLFALLQNSPKPVILLIDEFPIAINKILKGENNSISPEGRKLVDSFMSWFRQKVQNSGKIRFVISGSIGFEAILHQANLSATITSFVPFDLKPWDEPTAIGCMKALANQYGVSFQEGTFKKAVDLLGCCIPHHVQMFFDFLHNRFQRRNKKEISLQDVQDVYEKEMLGITGHPELTHYEERLKLVLDPEALRLALDMVTETASSGLLTKEALFKYEKFYSFKDRKTTEVLKELIQLFEHDGYLRPSERGYVFVSNLLRDWWKNRHGFLFVPVAQREF